MGFYQQFDQFDPKTDNVPYHPFSLLPNIVWRARSILNKRSHDEILTAAQFADWMIDDYFQQEVENFIQDQLQNKGWACKYMDEDHHNEDGMRVLIRQGLPDHADPDEYFDFATRESTTEVDALKACIESYDIEDGGLKNAKPHEYFAVLALWLVGDTLRWLKPKPKSALSQLQHQQDPVLAALSDVRISLSLAGEAAIQAMDAVCQAEYLRTNGKQSEDLAKVRQELHQQKGASKDLAKVRLELHHQKRTAEEMAEKKAAEKISKTARDAADKRHEENRAMRAQVIQHYEENETKFKSIEAAAEAIAGKIVPVKHRTVADWIREFRKQRSARTP